MRVSLGAGACLLTTFCLLGAEREVDPTFLHRFIPAVAERPSDVTTASCHYKPVFGAGDSHSRSLRGIARFGEIIVEPRGQSETVTYPSEEQVYVVLEGRGVLDYGGEKVPIRKNDFLYLPPAIAHGVSNSSDQPCRLIVMGFKIPRSMTVSPPPKLLLANIDDVKKQTVGGHPASTLYQLLMGDTKSTRDKLAAAHVLTSLFVMSIEPGGTNFPHHHERQEEIYLVLDGQGDMVAGGGMDGVEGRHPANAGDAYFFRLNCTVGFYASNEAGAKTAHILALRSWFPGMQQKEE
jgi:mannose-6-phosphate isomerase-like protein (cupin superfamily)